MSAWSEWQVAQFNECLMRGIGPEETAALLGRTKVENYEKACELGFVSFEESPSTAPEPEVFSKIVAAS